MISIFYYCKHFGWSTMPYTSIHDELNNANKRKSTNTTHYHIVTLSMVGRLDPVTPPICVIQK